MPVHHESRVGARFLNHKDTKGTKKNYVVAAEGLVFFVFFVPLWFKSRYLQNAKTTAPARHTNDPR